METRTPATARQAFSKAIEALRARFPLPEPDESGTIVFRVAREKTRLDVYVHVLPEQDIVSIMCPLGPVSIEAAKGELLGKPLLVANLLGIHTNGCAFSVHPGNDTIMLGYSIFARHLNADVLEEALGRVIAAGSTWKEQLGV